MKAEQIRPIPKNIAIKIARLDKTVCPKQKGASRIYSYLTSIRKELVKITVAVMTKRKIQYIKQVAVHGVRSDKCYVKDMEYNYMGMGYRVGWYAEGLAKYKRWFETGNWCQADFRYYNPASTPVNPGYVSKFSEYRYSAYQCLPEWRCVISYLRLYGKYPQVEYLLKLGLHHIHDSVTVLKRIGKDKPFCKWLIAHRSELAGKCYYIGTVMKAYKTGKPLKDVQKIEECKKRLNHDNSQKPIRELFKGKDLERFFLYLERQHTDPRSYLDYLKACNYLGLDMSRDKNRFPHHFKRWHDIRIDEYASARALADERERAALYKQFAVVAEKYTALQKCGKAGFAVFIAHSPGELIREGESLNHCVGRMGYDLKMVREESLIFFVREVDAPDTPFVTVEYSPSSKKVLQCYGNDSVKPDAPVIEFVNKVWLPYANRTLKKLTATAA
jgi:hypothetical protein